MDASLTTEVRACGDKFKKYIMAYGKIAEPSIILMTETIV